MNLRFNYKGCTIALKVALLAGSVAAVSALIVGSLLIKDSSQIIYQNSLQHLHYEAELKSLQLKSHIKNLSLDIQYLASTLAVKTIPKLLSHKQPSPTNTSELESNLQDLATIFTELIATKSDYLQIRYIGLDNNGKELVRVNRVGNTIQTQKTNLLQEKGDTDYFKHTAKTSRGQVYLSNITLNREYGKISIPHVPVLRAATPIYFNNKVFGIIIINMTFENIFYNLIKTTARNLTPYITNEDGYFIAHPDKTKTFGFDLKNNNNIRNTYSDFVMRINGDIRDDSYTTTMKNNAIHVIKARFDPANQQRFIAVMIASSLNDLQSEITSLRTKSNYIIGLLVIISFIFAATLTRYLLQPLRLISVAAANLAAGKQSSDLPVHSQDEIGELARSFERMSSQLDSKEQQLLISQASVHHTNKMATLGQMASGMAHEINSPIQTISLIAQRVQRQIKQQKSNKGIDESMNKIIICVTKISAIIESLRSTSSDTHSNEFKPIAIAQLLKDTINISEENFKRHGIGFEIKFTNCNKHTVIECQAAEISKAILNLIKNSFDAVMECDSKDKWISVEVKKSDELINFIISDSGNGISDEISERIFEPLFTTKDIGHGTGLGLSLARTIILHHQGEILLNKDVQHTCFVITLPLTQTVI